MSCAHLRSARHVDPFWIVPQTIDVAASQWHTACDADVSGDIRVGRFPCFGRSTTSGIAETTVADTMTMPSPEGGEYSQDQRCDLGGVSPGGCIEEPSSVRRRDAFARVPWSGRQCGIAMIFCDYLRDPMRAVVHSDLVLSGYQDQPESCANALLTKARAYSMLGDSLKSRAAYEEVLRSYAAIDGMKEQAEQGLKELESREGE